MIARSKMAPLLVGMAGTVAALCISGTLIYSSIKLINALDIDFNVGLYNYSVDVADHIQIDTSLDMNIPLESYLDKERIFPFQHGDSLVEIYNRGGDNLFRYSLNQQAPHAPPPPLNSFAKNSEELYSDFKENGRKWRRLVMPIDENEPPNLFLAVTVPTDFLDSQIQDSVAIMTGAGVTGFLLLMLVLIVVVYWATRSLRDLTLQIEGIKLDQRSPVKISVPRGPFEVTKLGETFNELLDRLARLVQSEKEFTANAAHQLKTPLTIARGQIELLLREPKENQAELLQTSLEEIDHLARIVDHLLFLTRIESGADQPQKVKIRLDELVTELISDLSPLARKFARKFRLQVNALNLETFEIETDPFFLKEALRNLLENALRYSEIETVAVMLNSDSQKSQLMIENEYGGKIINFDQSLRFQSGNHPNSGHGLGLSISIKLLKLLGFTISFKTDNSHFHVCIEIKKN